MTGSITEKDWKYLRSIQAEMLATLCQRINETTASILKAEGQSEHDKYQKSLQHIRDANGIIASCFDDWRRSVIGVRLISLQGHGLLTETHLQHLSEGARDYIKWSADLFNK